MLIKRDGMLIMDDTGYHGTDDGGVLQQSL